MDFWVLRRCQDDRGPLLARSDPAFLAAPQVFPLWRAVTFVVSWAFLALVYRILPDAKIAWRDVWVGAGVRALLFLRGNHLIGWCLAATSISLIYGAVGSIVIVLRWVYYSSQVAVRRGVHTSLHQTPRLASGTTRKRHAHQPTGVCLTDSSITGWHSNPRSPMAFWILPSATALSSRSLARCSSCRPCGRTRASI